MPSDDHEYGHPCGFAGMGVGGNFITCSKPTPITAAAGLFYSYLKSY